MQSGQVAAIPDSGQDGPAGSPTSGADRPPPGWVILGLHWEYTDEQTWVSGALVGNCVYLDERAARCECRRLCQAARTAEPPGRVELATGLGESDPVMQVLELLRRAGRPAPYCVQPVARGPSAALEQPWGRAAGRGS